MTKRIKAKFLFIKVKAEDGDIEVQYWTTNKMWSDVLNNTKQGTSFQLDRRHLQNVPVEYNNEVERKRTYPLLLLKDKQAS